LSSENEDSKFDLGAQDATLAAGHSVLMSGSDAPALATAGAAGIGPVSRDWLAAIIAGSDDAIISKDLEGNIRSWNRGATRVFGYTSEEVIGRPITILIPDERLGEEPKILDEIRHGRRVEQFETQRRRKDGALVDLSLTISPIHDESGVIVGASKIARDVTERRRAQETQRLLFGEMQHRIKNLFALTAGIVTLSGRSNASTDEVVRTIHERLGALARAHDLTISDWASETVSEQAADLRTLVRAILEPYDGQGRIAVEGIAATIHGKALTNMALVLHELATNAAKYGCLSGPEGHLDVGIVEQGGEIRLIWTETCGREISRPTAEGFGSRLEKSLSAALGATVDRDWRANGLVVVISVPKKGLAG
jgi:PAS domain S-box-containing protein